MNVHMSILLDCLCNLFFDCLYSLEQNKTRTRTSLYSGVQVEYSFCIVLFISSTESIFNNIVQCTYDIETTLFFFLPWTDSLT
jgi:hypothetical protein